MFKVRDLLIVAAFSVGIVSCYYRAAIREFFDPAIAPVEYYVDAPQREKELLEELSAAKQLAETHAQHIAVLSEEQALAVRQVSSLSERLSVVNGEGVALRREAGRLADALQAANGELTSLRAYKARFETLCHRIKQLDGDAHAIEQLVSE